ncbi:hypothetical protein LY78DRAFT_687141 [Colletotrichum sublineola]|nr:hypothetical protein LY78DRAFT_687141 [Colletotrichum sublineola]
MLPSNDCAAAIRFNRLSRALVSLKGSIALPHGWSLSTAVAVFNALGQVDMKRATIGEVYGITVQLQRVKAFFGFTEGFFERQSWIREPSTPKAHLYGSLEPKGSAMAELWISIG